MTRNVGELIGWTGRRPMRPVPAPAMVGRPPSARIDAEYRSDPVLRSMSVPRSGVDGVEFRIVFAFADPAVAPWPAPAPGTGGGAPRPSFGPSRGGSGGGSASPGTGRSSVDCGWGATGPRHRSITDRCRACSAAACCPKKAGNWRPGLAHLAGPMRCRPAGQALDEALSMPRPASFGRFPGSRAGWPGGAVGPLRPVLLAAGTDGHGRRAPARSRDPSALRGEIARARIGRRRRGKGRSGATASGRGSPGPDLAASEPALALLCDRPSAGPAPTPARPSFPGAGAGGGARATRSAVDPRSHVWRALCAFGAPARLAVHFLQFRQAEPARWPSSGRDAARVTRDRRFRSRGPGTEVPHRRGRSWVSSPARRASPAGGRRRDPTRGRTWVAPAGGRPPKHPTPPTRRSAGHPHRPAVVRGRRGRACFRRDRADAAHAGLRPAPRHRRADAAGAISRPAASAAIEGGGEA